MAQEEEKLPLFSRLVPWLLKNEKKPPKGFEKFFKKRDETEKHKGMCRN